MNFRKIITLVFVAITLLNTTFSSSVNLKNMNNKHCIPYPRYPQQEKEIQVFLHGKPVYVHIEGQPIQPTINIAINMTIIEC